MSKNTKILLCTAALLTGGKIFGVFGMLLAVPFIAVLQVFLCSLAGYYLFTGKGDGRLTN